MLCIKIKYLQLVFSDQILQIIMYYVLVQDKIKNYTLDRQYHKTITVNITL